MKVIILITSSTAITVKNRIHNDDTCENIARSFYLYFSARESGIDPNSAFDVAYALVSRMYPMYPCDLACYATTAIAAIDANAARVANITRIHF